MRAIFRGVAAVVVCVQAGSAMALAERDVELQDAHEPMVRLAHAAALALARTDRVSSQPMAMTSL